MFESLTVYFKDQRGFDLPEWTKSVYPEPWHSAAIDYYYLETNTTHVRQIMAGNTINLKKSLKLKLYV